MKQLSYTILLLGMAGSLTAQTLSFGEITLVTPATTPPTYMVNLVLTTANTANAGLVAGLQFDLNYNSPLAVTISAAGTALAASKEVSANLLPAANNPSTGAPVNNLPGQRAIITGVGLSDQAVSNVGGPSLIADGVVATLTIQGLASPTASNETLTLLNLAATSAGGNLVAAISIPLTVGAGSSDLAATGTLNLNNTYMAGNVYPFTADTVGNFGFTTPLTITFNDLIWSLFVITNAPTYSPPAACSDRLDAMLQFPLDTANTRGGYPRSSALPQFNDLLVELFRETNAPGYTARPIRTSLGGQCPALNSTLSIVRANPAVVPSRAEVEGTVVLGAPEGSGPGQDRVPVYLRAGRDLARLGFAFSLGDQQSQFRFEPAAGVTPTLMQDSQPGFIAGAWAGGLDLRAGQQLLLGYVIGPAGSAANLKVFGVSASGLDDFHEVGLDVSGAPLVRQ